VKFGDCFNNLFEIKTVKFYSDLTLLLYDV